MSLSVCLLTRNEEKNIERALRSFAEVADQILVADAASTDRTVLLATALGAEVIPFSWDDDFAAGRNFVISRAKGDWIFWFNGDEELLASSHVPLNQCMANDNAFGYFVVVQNIQDANQPQLFNETSDLRLFRRRPDLRYVGRCHPAFEDSIVESVKREGKAVLASAITLRSYAYLTERTEAKLRFGARLLEKELRDRPGQLRYLIEYGRTLLALKDPKGHDWMAEAVKQILPLRISPTPPSFKVQVLFEYLLTVPPVESKSPLSREEARELALRWFPASPPLLWLHAERYLQRKELPQAAILLEQLVQLGKSGRYDKSQNFDPGIIGDGALVNLGVCYMRLGQLDQAEHCFRRLLTSKTVHSFAEQNLEALRKMRSTTSSRTPPSSV